MIWIGEYSFEEFLNMAESFHGYKAPGVVIGGFMVDLAMKKLPENILFEAICETGSCLPDAVQMLTPCTTGNGWLKVINLGRYAVSLYDKQSGSGIRIFLDSEKVRLWSEIGNWFFKLKPKKEQDEKLLMKQIQKAGADICGFQNIRVLPDLLGKRHKGSIAECPLCKEAYPSKHGSICRACQGINFCPYALP